MARTVVIEYEPRDIFLPFHRRHHRWAVIVAHRRAGKTVACVNELIRGAVSDGKTNARYAYIAPFYSQAKGVAWDYLKFYAQPLLSEPPRESDLAVHLINGARIRLYGADNPNILRGLYFDGVILDEYADMKPSVWSEVVRPTLSDRKGWAVFIGTPKGKNAFWDIWNTRLPTGELDPEWFRVMLKASETGALGREELASARKSMTEDQYNQEYECSFEAAIHGAVYGKWMREALEAGRITQTPVDKTLPVHTAWDLGFDDSTAIWFWQVTFGEIRLVDYYENNGHGVPHYVEVIKSKDYTYGRHWVPHDAASELMAAGGRSIVNQLWDSGVKASIIPATSQQNSIEATRMTLPRCWFDEVKCRQGIEALRQYQFEFDEDKKTFRSKPRHDWASHGSDAFEIIGQVWRNPEAEKPTARPRFLEDMTAQEVFFPKYKDPFKRDRI